MLPDQNIRAEKKGKNVTRYQVERGGSGNGRRTAVTQEEPTIRMKAVLRINIELF